MRGAWLVAALVAMAGCVEPEVGTDAMGDDGPDAAQDPRDLPQNNATGNATTGNQSVNRTVEPVNVHETHDLNEGKLEAEYKFTVGPNVTTATLRVTVESQLEGVPALSYFACAGIGYVASYGGLDFNMSSELHCKHWLENADETAETIVIYDGELPMNWDDERLVEVSYEIELDAEATRDVSVVIDLVVAYD